MKTSISIKLPGLLLLVCTLATSIISCDNTTQFVELQLEPTLIPSPKRSLIFGEGIALSASSKLYSPKPELLPLLKLLGTELQTLTGIGLKTTTQEGMDADIIFDIDPSLAIEEYELDIDQTLLITGGSYEALAMAKTTLLQLVVKQDDALVFTVGKFRDFPDANYRGLLIDLARQWHSVASIKQIIDMSAFYKIRYLHLHFTDHQSFTFPTQAYPLLPTQDRHYSIDELKELEAYSQLRGVTIIPELEVPGHAQQFVEKYPEIFAIKAVDENPYIINMGNEEAYEALDKIIGEMTEVFQASPYFHIGGDEAYFHKVIEDPKIQTYIQSHGLLNDVHEVYRHFLVRMNESVKRYNKQMCVWEGFTKEGRVQIPKDILVFEFETNRYLPDQLVADGYTVVNTSWKPLYVVNQKKWSPESIYTWNMWRWENWWDKAPSFKPIQVEKTPQVIGAEMCSWEQPESAEIPSLRKRLPVFAQRVWNTSTGEGRPFEVFSKRLGPLDERLSLLIHDDRQDSLLMGYDFAAN